MGRAPGPLPGGTVFPGPGAEQRLGQIGKTASASRSRPAPARGLRATARLPECGSTGGRWEAREAQSQGRAGRARRGSWRDRSDRRRRAWLGVLNADRASGGGGGDTSLCLGARSRRQGRSRMVLLTFARSRTDCQQGSGGLEYSERGGALRRSGSRKTTGFRL